MNWRAATDAILAVSRDTFGELCTYSPAGHASFQLRGIFSSAHVETDPWGRTDQHPGFNSLAPRIDFKRSDLPWEPTSSDTVMVNSKTYRVVDKQFDGQSMMRLILAEA